MDIENDPWVKDEEEAEEETEAKEGEGELGEGEGPQPEIQPVPSSREQAPPPLTPEDLERLQREQRRKIWQPPIAEA